eukprot:scaffold205381_cov33-Prasinocladus_malaysianus.AAC.1
MSLHMRRRHIGVRVRSTSAQSVVIYIYRAAVFGSARNLPAAVPMNYRLDDENAARHQYNYQRPLFMSRQLYSASSTAARLIASDHIFLRRRLSHS